MIDIYIKVPHQDPTRAKVKLVPKLRESVHINGCTYTVVDIIHNISTVYYANYYIEVVVE